MGSCRCGYNLFTKRGGAGGGRGRTPAAGVVPPHSVPREQQWAGQRQQQLLQGLSLSSSGLDSEPVLGTFATGDVFMIRIISARGATIIKMGA